MSLRSGHTIRLLLLVLIQAACFGCVPGRSGEDVKDHSRSVVEQCEASLATLKSSSSGEEILALAERFQGAPPEVRNRAREILLRRAKSCPNVDQAAHLRRACLRTYRIAPHPDWTHKRVFEEVAALAGLELLFDPAEPAFNAEFDAAPAIPKSLIRSRFTADRMLDILEVLGGSEKWGFWFWIEGDNLIIVRRFCVRLSPK